MFVKELSRSVDTSCMIVLMEQLFIYISLAITGLALGSFAGATVWRLRARQLLQDKAEGEPVDKQEYKKLLPLTKITLATDRSRCLYCGHTLTWYDLLPLISWLSTGGKCRYCHKKIGTFEPLIELGMAIFFVGSYLLWPNPPLANTLAITQFILWLASGVLLAIAFAYDLKWFLLPNRVIFPLIGIGVVMGGLHVASAPDILSGLINVGGAALILSGLYYVLWLLSGGKWIGFGDIKLGLALALLLGDWQLAILTLFLANFIGCLIVIPGLLSGKLTRSAHVPFGPLLIVGFVLAMIYGQAILQWYFGVLLASI
jgi:prepilin signal peptidase PulO-like enzyme (type II secretory pathway)